MESTIVNGLGEIKREKCIIRGCVRGCGCQGHSHEYWRPDESKYPSELRRCGREVRLRRKLQDALDEAGDSPRNLLEMPSVFHRQAETGGHRRPCRKIPKKIQQEDFLSRGLSICISNI